jgi:hypothetical protein
LKELCAHGNGRITDNIVVGKLSNIKNIILDYPNTYMLWGRLLKDCWRCSLKELCAHGNGRITDNIVVGTTDLWRSGQ